MTNGSSSRQDYFTLHFPFSYTLPGNILWFSSLGSNVRGECAGSYQVWNSEEERYNRCTVRLWQVWPTFNVWANFFLVQSSRKWFIFYIGRYIIWMSEDYEAYWDNTFLMGSETPFSRLATDACMISIRATLYSRPCRLLQKHTL